MCTVFLRSIQQTSSSVDCFRLYGSLWFLQFLLQRLQSRLLVWRQQLLVLLGERFGCPQSFLRELGVVLLPLDQELRVELQLGGLVVMLEFGAQVEIADGPELGGQHPSVEFEDVVVEAKAGEETAPEFWLHGLYPPEMMQSSESALVQWQRSPPQLPVEVTEILACQEEWWICLGDYRCHNWSEVFGEMETADVKKVELGRNLNPRMILEVNHISFCRLQTLCFGKNNIASLQPLQHLRAPLLEWLSFEENHLTELRSLRKASFPCLRVLNLKSNRLVAPQLSELNAPRLEKVCLEFFHTDHRQGESLQWAFRLQTARLSVLRCRNHHRIRNCRQRSALLQRYPELALKQFEEDEMDRQDESESDK